MNRRPAFLIGLGLVGGLAAVSAVSAHIGGPPMVLINDSPSVAKGLYVRSFETDLARGTLVTLAQPAAAQAYLGRLGFPTDLPLLKRVAATSDDWVCAADGWLMAGHRRVPVARRDRQGRVLAAWTGCRRLGSDELLLLGDSASSFDSRYFGPVRRTAVAASYRELVRW